jgi:hypothetical protein
MATPDKILVTIEQLTPAHRRSRLRDAGFVVETVEPSARRGADLNPRAADGPTRQLDTFCHRAL